MVKLRQTASPADKANWREEFYTGHLNVVNGVVETDNLVWVTLLQQRGFTIVPEENDERNPLVERLEAVDAQNEAEREAEESALRVDELVDEAAVTNVVPELPSAPTESSPNEDATADLTVNENVDLPTNEDDKDTDSKDEPTKRGRKSRAKENDEHDNL